MSATSTRHNGLWQMATSFIRNHKRTIIEIASVVAFFVLIGTSISRCSYYKDANHNNIIALTDSVKYYKGKYGNEVASKTMVIAKYNDLKNINDSLYKLTESMKVKKPDIVIGGTTVIDNSSHDTVWVASSLEKEYRSIYRKFDFSDKYRELSGQVSCVNDTLGLHIQKDKVKFNYALAVKNNKVYMTSDNPYVKFSSITGLTMPEYKKQKKFGIGPSIFTGYGKDGFTYGIGIGIQYNLIRF